MIKGIFFDLFGTLVKADNLFLNISVEISIETNMDVFSIEEIIVRKYNEIFNYYHLNEFKSERYYYIKMFKIIKEELCLHNDEEYYVDLMYESFKHLIKYKDSQIIQSLKKDYFITIITNADAEFVRPNLMNNEIFYNDLIISDEVKLYKPDKRIFDLAVYNSKLNLDEIIFIGDNYVVDYLGSNAAGLKPILIDRENKNKKKNINLINTLYEINKYLR